MNARPVPPVAEVFASYPPNVRARALELRDLILKTAAAMDEVGPITETLKWGEPAYLTEASKSGSTIRIGWKKRVPDRYALYFNCNTNLVETFRSQFPDEFRYEGNRAIVFDAAEPLNEDAVAICVSAALTYHRNKKLARQA